MCGIIGYTGKLDAKDILLNGLKSLEYRGYDSAGIAFYSDDRIKTVKTVGKVDCLVDKVGAEVSDATECGIGHTRWATHGGVTDTNSHPHTAGKVTLIHNGIIENYQELQAELALKGKTPVSQTDTEIAAMVIEDEYKGDPYEAIKNACKRLDGAYGFCIMFEDIPGEIYCIRNGSPLVATYAEDTGSVIASDMVALISYSKDYFVLPEHKIAKLTKDGITVTELDGKVYEPEMLHVNWDVAAARKDGYEYFMLKEIHEQPEAIMKTITPRIVDDLPDFTTDGIGDDIFTGIDRVVIVGCGTAMHAGLVGKTMIEKLANVQVNVEIASEFRYADPILSDKTLVIAISQSGETADTLAAIRLAKEKGAKTLSVVNVKGSTIARESDYVLYTHAGPEIAVASTKAYTVQLAAMYLIAFRMAYINKTVSVDAIQGLVKCLKKVPKDVAKMLKYDTQIENITNILNKAEDLFFIGRGLDYALSCEGSIKLKEISYIHSESYAAGELKHGTISLITDNIPVIAIATQKHVYGKTISNVKEVRSRGANVILITNEGVSVDPALCDHQINLPKMDDRFAPFSAAVILQFIAYFASVHRGLNVDQPRNLAKSVTVE